MRRFIVVLVVSAGIGLVFRPAFAQAPVYTVVLTGLWVLTLVHFARHFRR